MNIKNILHKNILTTILSFSILINIFLLFNVRYGLWLFFCLTLWMLIVLLVWNIAFVKFKIKSRFKNPYSLLLINSFFLMLIIPEAPQKAIWFAYIFRIIQFGIFAGVLFLWNIRRKDIQANDGKYALKKWTSGKRLKILQILMIFLIIVQAFVIFPYVFEPVIAWKSEENQNEIQELVNDLIKDLNTDEEKTIVLLNWFERYSGNMYNNWGLPTLKTGIFKSQCLSFRNGHEPFLISLNYYIRPTNRDYPAWVFTTRSGRCDEHSILFREFASAADLEVRTVIGREFDHLWNEVKINNTWVTVDPSNVVHNKIWLDKNFSGYNLSSEYFISRFTKADVSFIYAEYPNRTKVPVTDRYVQDLSIINITVVNEKNKPIENIGVSIFSGSGLLAKDFETSFITDEKGKCQIQLGKGTITFRAKTDGFIYDSGEITKFIGKNQTINIKITLKKDYFNLVISALMLLITIGIIYGILKKKNLGEKKMSDDKKKGKVEEGAEKTGEAIGKVGKAGWGAVKGFGKGLKKGFKKEKDEDK